MRLHQFCKYSSAAVHFCHWSLNLSRSLMEEADIRFVISPELLWACRKARQECYFFAPSALIQQRRTQRFTLQTTGIALETRRSHYLVTLTLFTQWQNLAGSFVCLSRGQTGLRDNMSRHKSLCGLYFWHMLKKLCTKLAQVSSSYFDASSWMLKATQEKMCKKACQTCKILLQVDLYKFLVNFSRACGRGINVL